MKTSDLIAALANDAATPIPTPRRTMLIALAAGGLVSVVVFALTMGPRSDLVAALGSWRFNLKMVLVGTALLLTFMDCVRLANPAARGFATRSSLAIPALLFGAVAIELLAVPSSAWPARLLGRNALVCLMAIPALSLAPLAAALYAMRQGAPASSVETGLAAGRLAAAFAAALYALHCFDDSPLFIATWYVLASVIVIALGAIAGKLALRW